MSNAQVKAVARMQIESADHFLVIAQIGPKLHMAGDLDFENISICILSQAKTLGISHDEFMAQFTRTAHDVYKHPDQGCLIPMTKK